MAIKTSFEKSLALENILLKRKLKNALAELEAARKRASPSPHRRPRSPERQDSAYGSEEDLSSRSASPAPVGEVPECVSTWAEDAQVKEGNWENFCLQEEVSPENCWEPWEAEDCQGIVPELSVVEILEEKSRLTDREFLSTPAGQVPIPFDDQRRILEAVRAHAQGAFWEPLWKFCPDVVKKSYLHGWRTVRFGRTELEKDIGFDTYTRLARGLANGTSAAELDSATVNVVELRNALSHPHFVMPSTMHDLMERAQKLCCALGDEERAMGIRALRDEAHELSKQAFEELASCQPLAEEPAFHFQELFRKVSHLLEEEWREPQLLQEHGQETIRMAREWASVYKTPGKKHGEDEDSS